MRYIFLFFFHFPVFSQGTFSEVYYAEIDKAESAITEGKLKSAVQSYEKAFKVTKKVLSRDLFNAATCKILLNDFDGAKPYLLKMAARGVPTEVLEESNAIQGNYPLWDSFKSIYLQIQSDFAEELPEELSALLVKWESENSARLRYSPNGTVVIRATESVYIRGDGSIANKPDNSLISQIQTLLDSTGGFYEIQSGIHDSDLLLDRVNTVLFSNITRLSKPINYNTLTDNTFHLENYLLQGIQDGKLHRDVLNKLHSGQYHALAEVFIDEKCKGLPNGYYMKVGQNSFTKSGFSETPELFLAKALFKINGDINFKMGEPVRLFRKDFSTCSSAKEELQNWVRIDK